MTIMSSISVNPADREAVTGCLRSTDAMSYQSRYFVPSSAVASLVVYTSNTFSPPQRVESASSWYERRPRNSLTSAPATKWPGTALATMSPRSPFSAACPTRISRSATTSAPTLENRTAFIALNKTVNPALGKNGTAAPTTEAALAALASEADIVPTVLAQLNAAVPTTAHKLDGAALTASTVGVRNLQSTVGAYNASLVLSWQNPTTASGPITVLRDGQLVGTAPARELSEERVVRIAQPLLQQIVAHAAHRSFNAITVDGDTSTNDSFVLIASGAADMPEITDVASGEYAELCAGITAVAGELARAIVDFCEDRERCRRYGANARRMLETRFTKARALEAWKAILQRVANASSGA